MADKNEIYQSHTSDFVNMDSTQYNLFLYRTTKLRQFSFNVLASLTHHSYPSKLSFPNMYNISFSITPTQASRTFSFMSQIPYFSLPLPRYSYPSKQSCSWNY